MCTPELQRRHFRAREKLVCSGKDLVLPFSVWKEDELKLTTTRQSFTAVDTTKSAVTSR